MKITGYQKECDIWSAGVLLFTMIYGTMPFRGVTVREIKEKILAGKYILKESVSKEARKARARGLVTMGRIFQSYGSADAIKTIDFAQHMQQVGERMAEKVAEQNDREAAGQGS